MAQTWEVVARESLRVTPEAHGDLSVCEWMHSRTDLVGTTGALASQTSMEQASKEWERMHYMVLHKHCKPLGKVPVVGSLCCEAQRCVHEGVGKRSVRLLERLRLTFDTWGRQLGVAREKTGIKKWNAMLQSSRFVIRFQSIGGCDEVQHICIAATTALTNGPIYVDAHAVDSPTWASAYICHSCNGDAFVFPIRLPVPGIVTYRCCIAPPGALHFYLWRETPQATGQTMVYSASLPADIANNRG